MSNGWIHNFTVTDSNKHKKGYTIYKITTIVFPRNIPAALSNITIWKRYSEIKTLYKEISKKHKESHMTSVVVPEMKQETFFKRFEPDVIKERMDYILELLHFIAQHPNLYRSQVFIKFLGVSHTPNDSPKHHSNIADICSELSIPFLQPEIVLLDGNSREPLVDSLVIPNESSLESQDSLVSISTPDDIEQDEIDGNDIMENSPDYLFEAALEFTKAINEEVNGSFKNAFEKYKTGIDLLITGAKSDSNLSRKTIAREKIRKYLEKAEEIYETYILNENDENLTEIHLSNNSEAIFLERPINNLSKYKVVKIIENVMQVQDVTDKQFYIMKVIQKPSSNCSAKSIFLPQNIPFMVSLINYSQSDNAVYLLLKKACGGKLWDYILNYNSDCPAMKTYSLEEIYIPKIIEPIPEIPIIESTEITSDLIEKIPEQETEPILEKNNKIIAPSFDDLNVDMDVLDLVSCSKKLLSSVSTTLEYIKKTPEEPEIEFILPVVEEKIISTESHLNNNGNITKILKECNIVEESVRKSILNTKILLPEGSIRQWARELVVAIDSLHSNGVILGDLKMNNLLLGGKGQITLSYFYRRTTKPNEFSPNLDQNAIDQMYVAPERPLSMKSDWWSFGIILFELLTRYSFLSCHPGGISSYYEIQYPEDVDLSEFAKDLLFNVLQSNSDCRFGVTDIKMHSFFRTTDWNDVYINGL